MASLGSVARATTTVTSTGANDTATSSACENGAGILLIPIESAKRLQSIVGPIEAAR
jgi:hypothetical protein